MGNSVLVVEHDESMIRAADWVVDLGPGAGPDGGAVVAAGTPDRVAGRRGGSITAPVPRPQPAPLETDDARGRLARSPGWIEIRGAAVHNLKHVDARIPLAALTCVTGVSGSGKSTLVHDVLARSVRRALQRPGGRRQGEYRSRRGPGAIDQLIEVDQTPIGRSPRSTPATATGVFDEIRRVFAMTREAKIRGYGPSRFSFNARGGRCEACLGLGQRRIPMHFSARPVRHLRGVRRQAVSTARRSRSASRGSRSATCWRCGSTRAGRSSTPCPGSSQGLEALHDVGLGYLTLGQSSTTLSGGEAQRVKLAAELGRPAPPAAGRSTSSTSRPPGLHFADIDRLLRILHRLVDLGHTVVVIEHHLDVIASADWVIDLGPDGGRGRRPGRRHGTARRHRRRRRRAAPDRPSVVRHGRCLRQNPDRPEKTP